MKTHSNVEGVFALLEALSEEIESIGPDFETPGQSVRVPGYGKLYELPVGQLAAFVFNSVGVWERVVEISKSKDPNSELLALT